MVVELPWLLIYQHPHFLLLWCVEITVHLGVDIQSSKVHQPSSVSFFRMDQNWTSNLVHVPSLLQVLDV
jgi:hypothetical protein